MTFQQLRYLQEVHKTGSISKAAENLYVSRPSVSLSISSLESELGYPIFIRSQDGLIPSPQGQLVIKYANNICETHKLIKEINTKTQYLVRLSVVKYEPVNRAVTRLLDEYKNRNNVTFSISTNAGVRTKDVALGNIDIALSAKIEISNKGVDEQISRWNLQSKVLGQIPLAICIGPGHRLYNEPDISPVDFKDDPFLDTANRAWTSTGMLKDIVGANPQNTISLSYYPSLKFDILKAGLAYTIRRAPTQSEITQHKLRCIPLEGVCQRLICITDPRHQQPEAAERFIKILEEEL